MNSISRGVRNAFRNGIRTFSIVIIVGLSIGLALVMLEANRAVGSKIDAVKSSIGNTISIAPAGARGFQGGGEPLTQDQLAKVKATAHVTGVTESLQDRLDSTSTNLQSAIEAGSLGRRFNREGGGVSSQPGGAAGGNFTPPILVTGTSDASSSAALAAGGGTLKLTSGQVFDASSDKPVAMVGQDLASKNNLKVGSTFEAYGETITVAAIYDAGNRFSNSNIVMPLPTVQRLSQQPGAITSAVAQVDSITNVDAATTAIKSKLGDAADVVSQQDSSSQALEPLQNIRSISLISLIGAVIAGAVIILLTMLMIVRERRREIGVLKAIGATGRTITTQFMVEAATFTVLGSVVGLVIGIFGGTPVTKLLVSNAADAARSGGGMGMMRSGGVGLLRLGGQGFGSIQAAIGWDILAYGLLAALVIAVVGSAIPAWFTSRIRPAEVMRTE